MIVTDAQVHIWEPETPERPWPAGGRSFAHADELRPDRLLAEMSAAGVDRAVLVPPSFVGDDNDYLEWVMGRGVSEWLGWK